MQSGKIAFHNTALLILLLPLVILFLFGAACHGADIYVDDNTCPQTGSGTSGNPYCSIQYALSQAVSGDTVYVHNGTYAEAIVMKSGVDLKNVPGEQPQTKSTQTDNHVTFDEVNNCSIDGFLLDDSSRKGASGFAMVTVIGSASTGTGLAVRNCEIQGAGKARTGIRLTGKVSIEITGNTVTNNKNAGIGVKESGMDTIYDSTVTIQGNTITQNDKAGIYLTGGTGNRIIIGGDGAAANTISDNGTGTKGAGIRLEDIQGVSIDNNDIFNNGHAGIRLESVNTVAPHISRNTIHDNLESGMNIGGDSTLTIGTNNEIYLNDRAGIVFYVANCPDILGAAFSGTATITGNNIHTNVTAGISVIDHVTGQITIDDNTIYQNEKVGIAFFNHCTAVITNNDIYGHTGAAGIFTGAWTGGPPPASFGFYRLNGPVELTISRNKIHDNLSGMRLDHASGTISNNLVYDNSKSGIRFSGNDIAPYETFTASWGITELTNNTVADNGTVIVDVRRGGGIVYDDINNTVDRTFSDPPRNNRNQGSRVIKNNIAAYSVTAGIKDAACTIERDYNLYYINNGIEFYARSVLGGCIKNPNEIFADPLFVDRLEYQLQPSSPAKASGNDNLDMGAYGGSNPITW